MKDPITPIVPQPPRCKCVNLSFYEDISFYIWHKSRLLYLLSLVSQLFVQLLFSQIPPNVSQLINVRNKTIISSPIKHIKGSETSVLRLKDDYIAAEGREEQNHS